MRTIAISRLVLSLMLLGFIPLLHSQAKRAPMGPAGIEINHYEIEVKLLPDVHELEAKVAIAFEILEATDHIVFALSDNLSVEKVLDTAGNELEFGQNATGPGLISIHFPRIQSPGTTHTIKIEYRGGFDRDRFSRIYSRDLSSAYIGMEGSYLMYSAKWFPISRFLIDRAPSTLKVVVPLGMVAVGPGMQQPVLTRGVNEIFEYVSKTPILPGSLVVGHYFQRKLRIDDLTIECFAHEENLESIKKSAEAAARIIDFYQKTFGSAAAGKHYRLVEVEEPLGRHPGMLGTIFVTRRELAQPSPPVRELARRIAYQWWQETVGVQGAEDLWLVDGMAYFGAAQFLGKSIGAAAFKEEIENLAVLALKFESKSAVRNGLELGFRSEKYESVVAGKGAWILNMLLGIMGEEKFQQLTHQYFHDFSGKTGSTSAFRKLAEKYYGKDLGWFFAEWIDTIGVPEFQLDYMIFKTPDGFRVSGTVRQDRDLFRMPVEISVIGGDNTETKTIELVGKSTSFDITCFSMPEKIVLDPGYKLLRDSKELQTSVQLALGNDSKQKGDFVEAIRAYESALRINPKRSLAHFRLAEVFYEQFNLQSAANSFREALNGDRDPKWIEVWCYIYLGKIYDILGQRQRAMAEYTKAINTKDDTFGAQAEAGKWLATPFTRERTVMDIDDHNP